MIPFILIDNQSVIFLGECGFDRLKGEDLAFQTTVFEAQIRLAESISKPVVIHCVKAFNEIISIKKRLKPSIPLIIHGFHQNKTILNDLIKTDDIDMSIKAVYEKAAEVLNMDLSNLKKIVFDNFNKILTANNPS